MDVVGKETMLRISGGGSNDGVIASQFARSALAEAEERSKRISRLFNMEEILGEESWRDVRSALAGLRHINMIVSEIADFHSAGALGAAMSNLKSKIADLLKTAEEQHKALLALYP